MEKQNYQERDFNLVAKILLGLSMITTGMAIFSCMLKFGFIEYANVTVTSLIIEIVLDVLILIAGFAVFLKHRWGLIALTALFIIRMFATIPLDSAMYSYQLGGNMVHFFRDFGLFAIAMCFKKNGVSGWKSILLPKEGSGTETDDSQEVPKSGIVDEVEPIVAEINGEKSMMIQQKEDSKAEDEKHLQEDKLMMLSCKEEDSNECQSQLSQPSKNARKPRKALWVLVSTTALLLIGVVSVTLYVNSKDYPRGFEGFTNRFMHCFSIPNNTLARNSLSEYWKAADNGLDGLSEEFLEAALLSYPNDIMLLDSIGGIYLSRGLHYYFSKDIALHNKSYENAKKAYLRILRTEPANINAMHGLIAVYLNTEQDEKAYQIAEEILFNSPNDEISISLMCKKAYLSENWNSLVAWGKKGYELDSDIECIYYYAKGLYEIGDKSKALKYYLEAEEKRGLDVLHSKFQKIGGIPCRIQALTIKNETSSGKVLETGTQFSRKKACFLSPVVQVFSERSGEFYFDVKVYFNGHLMRGDDSPLGYSYRQMAWLSKSNHKGYMYPLDAWGYEQPGNWQKGEGRFEIWWEGNKLYSQSFNIY